MHPLDRLRAFATRIKALLMSEEYEELLEIIGQIEEFLN